MIHNLYNFEGKRNGERGAFLLDKTANDLNLYDIPGSYCDFLYHMYTDDIILFNRSYYREFWEIFNYVASCCKKHGRTNAIILVMIKHIQMNKNIENQLMYQIISKYIDELDLDQVANQDFLNILSAYLINFELNYFKNAKNIDFLLKLNWSKLYTQSGAVWNAIVRILRYLRLQDFLVIFKQPSFKHFILELMKVVMMIFRSKKRTNIGLLIFEEIFFALMRKGNLQIIKSFPSMHEMLLMMSLYYFDNQSFRCYDENKNRIFTFILTNLMDLIQENHDGLKLKYGDFFETIFYEILNSTLRKHFMNNYDRDNFKPEAYESYLLKIFETNVIDWSNLMSLFDVLGNLMCTLKINELILLKLCEFLNKHMFQADKISNRSLVLKLLYLMITVNNNIVSRSEYVTSLEYIGIQFFSLQYRLLDEYKKNILINDYHSDDICNQLFECHLKLLNKFRNNIVFQIEYLLCSEIFIFISYARTMNNVELVRNIINWIALYFTTLKNPVFLKLFESYKLYVIFQNYVMIIDNLLYGETLCQMGETFNQLMDFTHATFTVSHPIK
ncbi:hypothetical protein RF11_10265 [Thelohanellus kitauei]|uniref:Uncharacterized protein n=1 Tax=Thelohanellus kitauei TaxID=669202 RepID=A0A0C2MCA3_THEKT|nr:hypothetical protein RF11_08366 [Thelohanellus kitauei]KII72171.1 hypothetical protein RF11_10265 [Thelohanellus kitauei]